MKLEMEVKTKERRDDGESMTAYSTIYSSIDFAGTNDWLCEK